MLFFQIANPVKLSEQWDICNDVNINPNNCGGCGVVCGAGETCVAGQRVGI